jgi:DNA mismatch endonuclease (patch repair protein)
MRKQFRNYLGRNFNKERTPDIISKKQRSNLMSRIRSKNTAFESSFIKTLNTQGGIRFTRHVKSLRGNPDIVFLGRRLCVFLDSDFWHGWQYPRWKHLLKNDFWRDKIIANRKRDRRTTEYLREQGWIVIRLWEHSIKADPIRQIKRIERFLKKPTHR